MSLEWGTYTIGETCNLMTGFPFKSKFYLDSGKYNVVRGDNVKTGFIKWDEKRKCWNELTDNLTKFILKEDDIVIGMDGSKVGQNRAVITKKDLPALLAQRVACIRTKKDFNQDYVKYVILSNNFKLYVDKIKTGTSIPHISLNQIAEFPFEAPNYETQTKIAKILTNVDKKIEINKEINKNLNNLLELNFKKYLLNFENYSENELISSEYGLIPKGWSVSNLTMIADYQNGLAMQKFPPDNDEDAFKVLKIKELRQGFFDENSDICSKNIKEECIVYDGDVIFSWSGSLLVDLWTGGTCGLNQHLFKVTSSKFDKWFYYCWTKFYLNQFVLIAKDKATTMGHIKRQNLNESLVLIPDKLTYNKLTLFFEPIIDLIIKNKIEIKNLQKLRDTLLPKLMSGEIDLTKLSI